MADVTNRSTHESTISTGLFSIYQANGGDDPNFAAIEAQTREKLSAELLAVYLLMLGTMDDDFEIGIEMSDRHALAANYAQTRAADVSSRMVDNMRFELDQLRAMRNGGQFTEEEYRSRMADIFGESRAQTIAATEVTAAASAGEQAAASIATAKGNGLIAVWRTEEDGRVCPICAPLDQEPVEVWENEFPGGPPAHPNCRCSLIWVPENELATA